MKPVSRLFLLAVLLTMFAATTQAQVTANSTAEATIVATIDLTLDVPLNFGNLAVTNVAGVVTLEPSAAATRSQVGGVTFPVVAGTVDAATFFVVGEPNSTYAITIPAPSYILTITGPTAATMDVDSWTSSPSGTGLLDISGQQTLYVGADLHVDANQDPGHYISDAAGFEVTVNYN
ncbi:MAG: DUF4402 domain-containing protein [Bacteroidales bacterium]|nr:DUF4402 domain-containing protein [Bacteroidales bacterium]